MTLFALFAVRFLVMLKLSISIVVGQTPGTWQRECARGRPTFSSNAPIPCMNLEDEATTMYNYHTDSVAPTMYNYHTDSPVPPTFQTPGSKQIITRPAAAIAGNPRSTMTGVEGCYPHPHAHPLLHGGAPNMTMSPVVPTFQTPGAKQIQKRGDSRLADTFKQEPVDPVTTRFNLFASPEIPVFRSTGIMQISKDVPPFVKPVEPCPPPPTLSSRLQMYDTPPPPELTMNLQVYIY
jgi:hypothetical protein